MVSQRGLVMDNPMLKNDGTAPERGRRGKQLHQGQHISVITTGLEGKYVVIDLTKFLYI